MLIISPEPWGTSHVSKHHYARTLCEMGNEVWFLNPPGIAPKESGTIYKGLTVLEDKFHLRGIRFMPTVVRNLLLRRSANNIKKACGVDFDVIWSFDNSRHFNLREFKADISIHHVVDIGMNYFLCQCATSANIALASNFSILSELKKCQSNSHFLHHGFAEAVSTAITPSQNRTRIRVVYAGNLLIPFMDWPLVHKTVTQFPNVDFVFVGSHGKGNLNRKLQPWALEQIETLQQYPNVELIGEKPPSEVYSLTQSADILLLFYDTDRFNTEVENPHKVMNYLGAGKVVLSHPMKVYENEGVLEVADGHESFLRKFDEICSRLEHYNSPSQVERRIGFAKKHSYINQVKTIEELINKTVNND